QRPIERRLPPAEGRIGHAVEFFAWAEGGSRQGDRAAEPPPDKDDRPGDGNPKGKGDPHRAPWNVHGTPYPAKQNFDKCWTKDATSVICNGRLSSAAKMTYSGAAVGLRHFRRACVIRFSMSASLPRSLAALLAAALVFAAIPSGRAQNAGEQKQTEQPQKPAGTPPGDAAKEEKKKVDE